MDQTRSIRPQENPFWSLQWNFASQVSYHSSWTSYSTSKRKHRPAGFLFCESSLYFILLHLNHSHWNLNFWFRMWDIYLLYNDVYELNCYGQYSRIVLCSQEIILHLCSWNDFFSVAYKIFQVKEIYNFTQDDLTTEDVLVLDCHTEIYVWIGCHSNVRSKQQALTLALVKFSLSTL